MYIGHTVRAIGSGHYEICKIEYTAYRRVPRLELAGF